MFHCHIDVHNLVGMFVVLQVGNQSQHKPVPNNFPNCYDFLPEVAVDATDDPDEYAYM